MSPPVWISWTCGHRERESAGAFSLTPTHHRIWSLSHPCFVPTATTNVGYGARLTTTTPPKDKRIRARTWNRIRGQATKNRLALYNILFTKGDVRSVCFGKNPFITCFSLIFCSNHHKFWCFVLRGIDRQLNRRLPIMCKVISPAYKSWIEV